MLASTGNYWPRIACEIVLKTIPLTVLAAISLLLLRRASASVRAYTVRLSLLALLLLPLLTVCLPPMPLSVWEHASRTRPVHTGILPPASTSRYSVPGSQNAVSLPVASHLTTFLPHKSDVASHGQAFTTPMVRALRSSAPAAQSVSFAHCLPGIFAVCWMAGLLSLLFRLAVSLLRLKRLQHRALPASEQLQAAVTRLAAGMGIRRSLHICHPADRHAEHAPMTWGMSRPVLLLPSDVEAWPQERLQAVALHELAHIVRGDWGFLILTEAVCALYWFHPLVWILVHHLRRESEQACDDRVLSTGVKPSNYAGHLLEVVRMSKTVSTPPNGAISMAEPSLLEVRIRAVIDGRRSRRPLSRLASVLALGGLIALISPLSAARLVEKQEAHPTASTTTTNMSLHPVAANSAPPSTRVSMETGMPDATRPVFLPNPSSLAGPESAGDIPNSAVQPTRERGALNLPDPPGDLTVAPATEGAPDAPAVSVKQNTTVISWGKESHGLQAGLRDPSPRKFYTIGDTVRMEYIIRNVSSMPIQFEHEAFRDVNGTIPEVIDHSGKALDTFGEPYLHINAVKHETLNPDEMVVLGRTGMVVLGPPARQGAQTLPSWTVVQGEDPPITFLYAGTGEYQMRHLDTIRIQGTDPMQLTLYTGYLPLLVREAPASIAWGEVKNGLRVGLSFAGNRREYALGDTIRTDLYVENVSPIPIKISYISNRDMFFLPILIDNGGKPVKIGWQNDTLPQKLKAHMELLPGATICIAHPYFTISNRSHQDFDGKPDEVSDGTWFMGRAGQYRVRMPADLMSPSSRHAEDALTSGEQTLTVK